MSPSPDAQPAASAAQSATLGMGAASTGLTYDLNGVTLECANIPTAYPDQGDPDHPEWLWPTTLIEYRLDVQMSNGQIYWVNRPPNYLQDGRIQVSLRAKTGTRMAVFNVPADQLETPIWFIGRPIPTPEPPVEPVPTDDTPPDNTSPTDPQTPVEPTDPPAGQ